MGQHLLTEITWGKVCRFTIPTIIMMIFMALYQMVDGVFISNFVGPEALSAVNIVYPAISVVVGVSIMLGSGANAIIARTMGEGRAEKARRQFTAIVLLGIGVGAVIALAGSLLTRPIVRVLGATPVLVDYSVDYIFFILLASPFAVLQLLFQVFFVTAGRPNLGLLVTMAGGVANIVFDYVFIVMFGMGTMGAGLGTAAGYMIPAVAGLVYFSVKRDGTLFFMKPEWSRRMIVQSCGNGSSEMVSNLATAVTTFLFNHMMLKYLAEDGVAAITVALYLQFFLSAVFMGYSMGVAPVFSYHYGRGDRAALGKLFRISCLFIAGNSILWYGLSMGLENVLIGIFASPGSRVFEIAREGWWVFALTFLLIGSNIFASSLFTSLSDGKRSAIISFLRTFLFLSSCILLLPRFLGSLGIWMSAPVAEALTLAVSAYYVVRMRKVYGYGDGRL